MRAALAILLLCAACSSGGSHKRPTYPPGYVLTETVLRGDTWERYEWHAERSTLPEGQTIERYRHGAIDQ